MHDIVLYNYVENDEIFKRVDNEAVLEMETLAYGLSVEAESRGSVFSDPAIVLLYLYAGGDQKDEKGNGGQYPDDSRRRGTGGWTKGYGEGLNAFLYLFLTCFFTVIWGKMKDKECGQNRPEKLRNQGVMEWQ